jgi:hypothetical protein
MSAKPSDLGVLARQSTLRRSVALLLIAIASAGCMTWRPAIARPAALIAQRPEQVRVSLERGGRVVLYAPTVAGEELLGYRRPGNERSRIAIPLRDIALIEVKGVDARRTAVLAGAATFTGIVIVGAAEWRSSSVTVRLF